MLAPLLGEGTPEELRWYGLLWGPWFVLGGVLFLLAARRSAQHHLCGEAVCWPPSRRGTAGDP